jgi:hypothetical protein
MGDFWRDVREQKKARRAERAAHQSTTEKLREEVKTTKPAKIDKSSKKLQRRRCWDWIMTSGTFHYAKNRSSFKSYRHISLVVQTLYGAVRIIGIGKVALTVKLPDSDEISELVLRNVLHIPDALCNGFSPQLLGGSWAENGQNLVGSNKKGGDAWYAMVFHGLFRLELDGHPQDESLLAGLDGEKSSRFDLILSLEERVTLQLPHRSKISSAAKRTLEPPIAAVNDVARSGGISTEGLHRRSSDSDDEWVIDNYDSDGSEQEGIKVGHPNFAKWLQDITVESLTQASEHACSPEILLSATAKGIQAVTEMYKIMKPDVLQAGNLEESLAKKTFKSAFDAHVYQTLDIALPAKAGR